MFRGSISEKIELPMECKGFELSNGDVVRERNGEIRRQFPRLLYVRYGKYG